MALYFCSHTTACLTKQQLRALMSELLASTEVKVKRSVAGQLGGRMITEIEASDLATLERWFEARRLNCEWVVRIDLDGRDGAVTEY